MFYLTTLRILNPVTLNPHCDKGAPTLRVKLIGRHLPAICA